MAESSTLSSSQTLQTPGAGSSRPRPRPRPSPIPIPSPGNFLSPPSHNVRARTPTRSSTMHQEVELGVYLRPEQSDLGSPSFISSSSPSRPSFSFRRASVTSQTSTHGPKSLFLANSEWHTDIVTFCSHARLDPVLGQARITHVQARKSRRPPFLHEYILVFFTAAHNQRFVARIDRLGKIGLTSVGGLLGYCGGRHGLASNTAIQQVGVYHVQDGQSGLDCADGPWFAGDRGWGSEPIATLVTWSNTSEIKEQVSHHVQTALERSGPSPRLKDVSRLLEAILLEMPTYHLMTTNCYFMTRSSLLLLQRCFPTSFACYIGSSSGDLIASSDLAEPVWAGLLRWYLPFVIVIFLLYVPMVALAHVFFFGILSCRQLTCPVELWVTGAGSVTTSLSHAMQALQLSAHGFLDVPLPVGLLHAWMTGLEVTMNDLVMRLSTQYHELERAVPGSMLLVEPQPFGVAFQQAWTILAAWCGVGALLSLMIFIFAIAPPMVFLAMFLICAVAGVVFNFMYSDTGLAIGSEDVFGSNPSEETLVDNTQNNSNEDAAVSV